MFALIFGILQDVCAINSSDSQSCFDPCSIVRRTVAGKRFKLACLIGGLGYHVKSSLAGDGNRAKVASY
jgi:hypothetical protein